MSTKSLRSLGGALAGLVLCAAVVGAQSLGELAAKEQERREKERQKRGGAAKVITENELRRAGRGTVSNAGASGGESSAPAASSETAKAEEGKPAAAAEAKEKTPDEVRAEQENDWRQRTEQARDEVTRQSARVERLQQGLSDLSGELYGSTRATLLSQWETAKKDLAAAQQKVADLEEEGRTQSYR